jgi:hypothetical protein
MLIKLDNGSNGKSATKSTKSPLNLSSNRVSMEEESPLKSFLPQIEQQMSI